ncbi:hypothetical protein [Pseudoalteromonas sp. MTN2-4]|uniref:hypothetical protein n=1 Tax=Pseudoalteromonas sp. MTN2-4 TaxID=3056555 RepID=UPI0036F31096
MQILKIIILLSFLSFFSGCSSTGGTIGGLFPAPKLLDGKIENNTYFSKDGDFSVSIPHKEDTYEYTYLQVKEQYGKFGTYISFGPAAIDQSIYRLEIGKKLSPESKNVDFDTAVESIIANYSKQLELGYKSQPSIIKKEKASVNGFNSYIVELTQKLPNQTFTHEVVITDYPTMAAIFWVQKSSIGQNKASINTMQFAKSFKVL